MADTGIGTAATGTKTLSHAIIETKDYSKEPNAASEYADMRGVVDYGNLFQFAPFEGGYCFLAVINAPYIATQFKTEIPEFESLQNAFVKILEQEFKGLSGIEDITADTMDVAGDGINTLTLLGKVSANHNTQISMSFTEKTGSLITKYIAMYLRFIRDPDTQARTYGGHINVGNAKDAGWHKEVFNMLYIVTDSTCLNVEKAFLILNAQPMTASYSELYNTTKGEISTKDVTVTFNAFVVDGKLPNKIAKVYIRNLIKTDKNPSGNINLNSYDFNWSVSGLGGKVRKGTSVALDVQNNGEAKWRFNIDAAEGTTARTYFFDSRGNNKLYGTVDYNPLDDSLATTAEGAEVVGNKARKLPSDTDDKFDKVE